MNAARARTTYLTFRVLAAALDALPEPVAEGVAAAVGEVLSRRRGLARDMSARHLERVLASDSPLAAPDAALVRRWSRRAFASYARYWVEGARMHSVPAPEVRQRLDLERGWDHLTAGMASGRGVILALPHVGSWEWGGAFLALEGYPMTAVAEVLEPPELFEWFIAQRRAMGLNIVPLGPRSGAALVQTLGEGGLVGLVCDRDLVGNGLEVEYFGERTTMPAGPATLALRTGAVLMTAAVYSGPGRDHTAVINAPLDTARTGSLRAEAQRLTQEIATEFEQLIRRAPAQWHLFQPNWPSDEPVAAAARQEAAP